MAADQTSTVVTTLNTPLAQLSLTTTPKEYAFVVVESSQQVRRVACVCTADWLWSNLVGGVYVPVSASPNGFEFDFTQGSMSIFMKMASGTGTLTPVVTA